MKKTLFLWLFAAPFILKAQSDPPLVAQGAYETDLYQWSFSVGDLTIKTLQTQVNCWTQGTQQPVLPMVATHQSELLHGEITVFPNPVERTLNCLVETDFPGQILYAGIYTPEGRNCTGTPFVLQSHFTAALSVQALPSGHYVLQISDTAGRILSKIFQKN